MSWFTTHSEFLLFCFVGGFLSYHLLRRLLFRYHRLETNHEPPKESLGVKILKLWKTNTIIAVFGMMITLFYSVFVSPLLPNYTLDSLAVVALMLATGNIVIRISSYGYTNENSREYKYSKGVMKDIKTRLHDAGFSFIFGLWFIMFIGIGLSLYNDVGLAQNVYPSGSLDRGVLLLSIVIFGTLSMSVLSEFLLWIWPLTVPEFLSDRSCEAHCW